MHGFFLLSFISILLIVFFLFFFQEKIVIFSYSYKKILDQNFAAVYKLCSINWGQLYRKIAVVINSLRLRWSKRKADMK